MEADQASNAMDKLLRKSIPFEDEILDHVVRNEEAKAERAAADKASPPGLVDKIRRMAEFYRGLRGAEIHRLTYREEWPVKADVRQAQKVAEQGGYDPDVRQEFVNEVYLRSHAKASLRVAGTNGRVPALTDEQASSIDLVVAAAVFNAYQAAFVLTESETPKAPAPPSTPA
jgi:hypothetical protein